MNNDENRCTRTGCFNTRAREDISDGFLVCVGHLGEALARRRQHQQERDHLPKYAGIRPDTLVHIRDYADHGGDLGGSFLHAVMSNNLMDAVLTADPENLVALPAICLYVWNEIPMEAWGSPAKVCAWIRNRRRVIRLRKESGIGIVFPSSKPRSKEYAL